MKANEFVKKFGLIHSKLFGNGWITFDDGCIENSVSRTDVKRLVESWELIESYGGVAALEKLFHVNDVGQAKIMRVGELDWHDAKQAIADVESCQ